jgi:DNA-binding GntR family transcriptional regulator
MVYLFGFRETNVTKAGHLSEDVAKKIEMLIVDGRFGSGDKLTEKALMAQFAVSRGTVREALRRLEGDGLVSIKENRGAFVRTHSLKEALDMYDLRCELTAYAARLVATVGTAETVERLEALVARMKGVAAAGDCGTYYMLNLEFHDTLMKGSGNQRAVQIYDQLVREAHLHRPMQLTTSAALWRSQEEHGEIVEAIREGDAKRADAAARAHVTNGKLRFVSGFGQAA